MKLKADIGVLDIVIHILMWIVLSFITLGIAMFFYPYSFAKFVINRSVLIDDMGRERTMDCQTDIIGNIWHILIWAIISIVTFGLGYVFYFYKVWNYSLNATVIEK